MSGTSRCRSSDIQRSQILCVCFWFGTVKLVSPGCQEVCATADSYLWAIWLSSAGGQSFPFLLRLTPIPIIRDEPASSSPLSDLEVTMNLSITCKPNGMTVQRIVHSDFTTVLFTFEDANGGKLKVTVNEYDTAKHRATRKISNLSSTND